MRISHLILLALLALPSLAVAEDLPEQKLTIKNHVFTPSTLTIPHGQKVKLIITNNDDAAAEFESYDMHREKIIPAHDSVTVFVGPLDAGSYPFFDDFHRDTTTGTLIVQ